MQLSKRVFFDNTSLVDQVDANLDDIVDELNNFYEGANSLTALPIDAYGPATVNLNDYPSRNTIPIPIFNHRFGYRPVFIVYYFVAANNSYTPLPALATAPADTSILDAHITALVDQNQLYVFFQGSAPTPQQSFYYFLFKTPESA